MDIDYDDVLTIAAILPFSFILVNPNSAGDVIAGAVIRYSSLAVLVAFAAPIIQIFDFDR